jgi:hypothetical protein
MRCFRVVGRSWIPAARLPAAMLAVALAGCFGPVSAGEARVDFEVVTEAGLAVGASREWFDELSKLGVDGLRVRAAVRGDAASIEQIGADDAPRYRVRALLSARGQLVVPEGRFRRGEERALADWIEALRRTGPPRPQGSKPLPFGLAAEDLVTVETDLARRLSETTLDRPLSEVLEALAAELQHPLSVAPRARGRLSESEKVGQEYSGLSAGTVLACLLRGHGLAMTPRRGEDGRLEYVVELEQADREVWPTGWPPVGSKVDLMPALYEIVEVDMEGVSLAEALQVICERTKLRILYDDRSLAASGVALEKVTVKLPARKWSYNIVVSRLLSQGKMSGDLRRDEAGTPFLWVTAYPPSPVRERKPVARPQR